MKKNILDDKTIEKAAVKFLQKEWNHVSELEKRVIRHIIENRTIAFHPDQSGTDERTFGERIADRVASFGGSWTFIIIFAAILVIWVILNSFILAKYGKDFDPYPYILLNLFLSMIAALQAPVIMMSQNRQAIRDRLDAKHDYEVNLKAELEIGHLHQKFDELRETKWVELIEFQQKQIDLLEKLGKK